MNKLIDTKSAQKAYANQGNQDRKDHYKMLEIWVMFCLEPVLFMVLLFTLVTIILL